MKRLLRQFARPQGALGLVAAAYMLFSNRSLNRRAIEWLEAQSGQRILDIGFGPGYALRSLSTAPVRLVGIEVSRLMIRVARGLNRRPARSGQVCLLQAPAGRIPLASNCCDGILAANTLSFWEDSDSGLAEAQRVLKAGGRLVVAMQPRRASERFRLELGERVAGQLRGMGFGVLGVEHADLPPAPAVIVVAIKPL